jgi:hypothetical protein
MIKNCMYFAIPVVNYDYRDSQDQSRIRGYSELTIN